MADCRIQSLDLRAGVQRFGLLFADDLFTLRHIPDFVNSATRFPDPCPYLSDRRAAPPCWGSVAALPLPCGPEAQCPDSHVEVQAPWPISRRPPSLGSGTRIPAPTAGSNAGAKVPIRLTVRQEEYCRQAIDIHRFCYNLAVRTHRFCRRNRLLWPSWQDISKAFNACKREDHPFVTQVAAVVATGAFRDFGQAVDNWRNPELRARVPRTKRPAFAGAGSFLAAGSMKEVRYDGKRRVKLPCLGSVKLGCTLPRGICYEASIRRENGRWYICLKLWKPPEPRPERASRPGGIDTGINPLGTDSDGQVYREPQSQLPGGEETEEMAAGPGPAAEGLPVAGGKPSGRSTSATGASGA